MYDELTILAANCIKSIWERYEHTIKPGHFSEIEHRQIHYKIGELHGQPDSPDIIPIEYFKLKLPKINPNSIQQYLPMLDDFAIRCKLADVSLKATQVMNNNKLLTAEDLQSITGGEVTVFLDDKMPMQRRIESTEVIRPERIATCFVPLTELLEGGASARELVLFS